MSVLRIQGVLLFGVWLVLHAVSAAQADEESAKQVLADKGFRVLSTGLVCEKETELKAAFRDVTKMRKSLLTATRDLGAAQAQSDQLRAQLEHLQKQLVELNARLVQVNAQQPDNVSLNNQLVGALNATQGQSELLRGKQNEMNKALEETRQVWVEAREDYLQLVLDMRVLADEVQEFYDQQAEDDELQSAIAELNEATGKEYTLEPSRSFLSSMRRLETLEEDVLSESIELRRENNTLYANVVVNGDYKQEMVVDSGASLICLPAKVAQQMGVEPDADSPPITLVMADGREIMGRLVELDEVRVGKFKVEKVEAAVLGPEATNAEPLLGMSFLGNFKFELDAKAATLDMVNIEGANPADEKDSKPNRRRR